MKQSFMRRWLDGGVIEIIVSSESQNMYLRLLFLGRFLYISFPVISCVCQQKVILPIICYAIRYKSIMFYLQWCNLDRLPYFPVQSILSPTESANPLIEFDIKCNLYYFCYTAAAAFDKWHILMKIAGTQQPWIHTLFKFLKTLCEYFAAE